MRSFILAQIIISLFYLVEGQLKENQECNNGKGECKFLNGCPIISLNLNDYIDSIQFCDSASYLICCPKRKPSRNDKIDEFGDKSKISVRECISYQQRVYEKCAPQGLIISGTKAEPHEFPHMALLGEQKPNQTKINWGCGGTLISPRWVLTAAHCFYSYNFYPNRVRLGELDFAIDTDDAQPQDFEIKRYVTHPDYDEEKNYNDMALVELSSEAVLNKYVVPACLPLTNGTEFAQFLAAGWGATKNDTKSTHLLKVRLERFDDDKCKDIIELPDKLEFGIHVRTQLCAGSKKDSRDTCQGDSGGPLFIEHPIYNCMYLIVGVTSFGQACGIAGLPGVYSRVNLFVEWIENIVWSASSSL